jgi:hypothetical protein
MKNQNSSYYISIVDVNNKTVSTQEIPSEWWNEINNEPTLKSFSTKDLSENLAYKLKKEETKFVSATHLVYRHINESDKNLTNLMLEQNHRTFVIIIDIDNYKKSKVDRPSFVFASNPINNLKDAEDFGNGIGYMYLETSQKIK